MKSKIKYSTQLLISFIIVLFIPMLLTSVIFMRKTTQAVNQNEVSNKINLMTQITDNIDGVFTEVQQIALQVPVNSQLSLYNVRSGTTPKLRIVHELSNYVLTSKNIEDIALYYTGDDRIYFSYGSSSLDLYFDSLFQCENWGKEQFLRELKGLNSIQFLPCQEVTNHTGVVQNLIIVLYPVKCYQDSSLQTLIFTIDASRINSTFYHSFDKENNMGIYWKENLLYSAGKNSASVYSALSLAEISVPKGTIQAYQSDRDHLLLIGNPAGSYFTYVSQINQGEIYHSIRDASRGYWLALLIIYLIAFLVLTVLWRLIYKPVNRLLNYTRQKISGDLSTVNEFETVRSALDSISESNAELSSKYNSTRPAYREHLLCSLLNGEYSDIDTMMENAASVGINLNGTGLGVFCVEIPHEALRAEKINELCKDIEAAFPKEISAYGVRWRPTDCLAFLFSYAGVDVHEIKPYLQWLYQNIAEKIGSDVSIGCSTFYRDPSLFPECLNEALTALDYHVVYGYSRLIFFDDIDIQQESNDWYPRDLMTRFDLKLKSKNREETERLFEEVMSFMRTHHAPLYMVKYVCYDVMRSLANVLLKSHDTEQLNLSYRSSINIARLDNFEQIHDTVRRNVRELFDYYEQEHLVCDDSEIKDRIEKFIEIHYLEYDFSLSTLADAFSMSETSMRRIFKSVMKTTYIDYLMDKRIEKSKELLEKTDLSLKDICGSIGYANVSAFIRRFKQEIGMTPGEYRILKSSAR